MSFDLNVYGKGELPGTEDLLFGLKNAFIQPQIDPEIDLTEHKGFLPVSWEDPFDSAKRIEGGVEVDVSFNENSAWEVLVSCGKEQHELLLCWLLAATFATKGDGQLYDNQTGESFEGKWALWRAYKAIKVQKLLPYPADQAAFDKLKEALMSNKLSKLKKALKSSKNVYALNDGRFQILNYYMGGPHYFDYEPKEVIELMLNAGLSITHNGSYSFMSSLSFAIGHKRTDLVQFLIEKGADVNFPNEQWDTALHAVFKSFEGEDAQQEIIKILITAGADIHIQNHEGQSPLDIALERAVKLDNGKGKKADDLRPLLSELGISVNTTDQHLDTGIKLFWMDYATGDEREASEALPATEQEAIEKMTILSTVDSFLGIITEDVGSVQFIYDGDGNLRLDIPDVENDGSYTKSLTLEEALQIITAVFNGKDPKTIVGVEFDSWY